MLFTLFYGNSRKYLQLKTRVIISSNLQQEELG